MAIIYLYESTTTDFIYNGQPFPKAYEVTVDRTINDEFFVTGKHPLDENNRYKLIQKDKIIKAHTPDGMQPFRIMDVNKRLGYVEFEAWPLLYADLRNKLIKPFKISNSSGQTALNTFINNLLLGTKFSFTSNILSTHDFSVRDETEAQEDPNQLYDALEVFKRIVNRWSGEIIINGYDIRLVSRLGKDTDALLYEKKNITDFVDKESIQGIVTRVHGKSEWTEDGPDGKQLTKRIKTTVDSPLINAYSGIVFEQQFTNNDIRTEQELKNWLTLKFSTENIDKPSRTIELDTNIVDETEVALGDKLNLKYLKHDVDMLIRMTKYQYDGFNNRYIKIFVGDALEHFTGSVQNTISVVETNIKNSVDNTIAHVIINQLGQKIIYSEYEPEGDFNEGDIWFDNKGGMFIWNEESANWIPHPFNNRMDAIGQEVKAAIEQADIDRNKAEQDFETSKQLAKQYTDAEVLKFDTKFITETGAIRNEIQTGYTNAVTAGKAYTDTKSNEFNSQLELVKTDVANTVLKADSAVLKADKAISDAGFAKVDADTAKQNALTAVSTANTAKTNAETALGKANTAITNSGTALSTAQTAITNSGTAITNAQTALNAYNNLEIGGRNLLLNSGKPVTTISGYLVVKYTLSEDFISGETYTFTLKGTKKESQKFGVWQNGGSSSRGDLIHTGDDVYELTFVAVSTTIGYERTLTVYQPPSNTVGQVDISWAKLVKGNKSTSGWTPAPEDVQVQITDINGELARKVSQTTFDNLNGVVGTHTTQIGQTQTALTTKADSQLVNTIKGTVDKHTVDIATTSQGLTFKADSSLVDTIKGTVEKHTLDIAATNQGLSFKADSSRVDTIKGTVDSHTTELGIQAQAISARLTSTQVNSLVAGKNYVNQTALNATANGLSTQITQVETDLGKKSDIIEQMNGGGKVFKNPVRYSNSNNSFKSYLVITTPIKSPFMVKLSISGYNYTSEKTNIDLDISFYAYTATSFVNYSYTNKGNYPIDKVQLARNSTGDVVIIIGGENSIWSYPKIQVTEAIIGHSNPPDTYQNGWIIGYVTTLSGLTAITNTPGQDYNTKITTIDATVNGVTTTVSNHTGQISSLQQIATGLQTTVLDKADKTQVTQLANQWTQTTELVTGHTGQISNLGEQIDVRVVKGDVIGQITVEAGRTLIKNGQLFLDADTYIMGTTFANEIKAKSLESVYADIATLRTKFLIVDLITSAYLKVDNALVDKMTATTSIVDRFFSKTAVIDNIETKSLAAVYADIPTIRNKVLITDSVTAGMVKADAGLFDKVFINDAVVQKLTVKASFINSVKAIDITADRVTGGTANFANFNVINFNANNITSGSLNGANYSNNLNTGVETFTNPSTGDILQFTQGRIRFQNGAQERLLNYNAEGLQIKAGVANTGTSKNTSLWLIGEGSGSYAYIQFVENNTSATNQRIEAEGGNIRVLTAPGGKLEVRTNGTRALNEVLSSAYQATGVSGAFMRVTPGSIETERYGNRSLKLMPTGTGKVEVSDGTYWWNVKAKEFETVSSRTLKTNINTFYGNALSIINNLTIVTYNMKQDLKNGVDELKLGLISEDSPSVASSGGLSIDMYKLNVLTAKGVQELDQKVISIANIANASNTLASRAFSEMQQLKNKVTELELKIKKLESVA